MVTEPRPQLAEPASVVAARQLAEEARARRADVGCATTAVVGPREQQALHTRRIRAALLAAGALTTAGCGAGLGQACPAIGYSSALVVQLDGWPAGAGRQVELDCDPACSPPILALEEATPVPLPGMPGTPVAPVPTTPTGTTPAADPVLPVDGSGRAVLQLYGAWPDQVTVRVLDGGAVVAEQTAQPEFVRVDGTEECGGNAEGRIVVPAP